jgi:hypothetical protein
MVELLYGGGMYDEKFSSGNLRPRESHVFFSLAELASLCDSNFRGEVYVLLSFFIRKGIKLKTQMQSFINFSMKT